MFLKFYGKIRHYISFLHAGRGSCFPKRQEEQAGQAPLRGESKLPLLAGALGETLAAPVVLYFPRSSVASFVDLTGRAGRWQSGSFLPGFKDKFSSPFQLFAGLPGLRRVTAPRTPCPSSRAGPGAKRAPGAVSQAGQSSARSAASLPGLVAQLSPRSEPPARTAQGTGKLRS